MRMAVKRLWFTARSGFSHFLLIGLARAYVIQGEKAKAKASYQDFLTLWKDADAGIPILEQAKDEYAKLQ